MKKNVTYFSLRIYFITVYNVMKYNMWIILYNELPINIILISGEEINEYNL